MKTKARLGTLLTAALLIFQSIVLLVEQQAVAEVPAAPTSGHGQSPVSLTSAPIRPGGVASSQINLDLSSTVQSVNAGNLHNFTPTTIVAGGTQQTVTATSILTPAQAAVVEQIIHTGQQSLLLASSGKATGGTLFLTPSLGSRLSNLIVPNAVTVIDKAQNLVLPGNLTNAGNFFAVPSRPDSTGAFTGAFIQAGNIYNQVGGVISTVLPVGGVSGVTSPNVGMSLKLSALGDIVNAGSIISGANLALTAGTSITNAASKGSAQNVPLIQAVNDVTIVAGSGALSNVGSIVSKNGSINISTILPSTDLNVSAMGGVFQAANGAISFRNLSYNGSSNLNINGGSYFSQSLNLCSGEGAINAVTEKISGSLNSCAGIEHVTANTTVLTLRDNTVDGDPTFINTGGDILISGVNTFNANVAILASGNIFADSTGSIVDRGNNVTLVAGAGLSIYSGAAGGTSTSTSTVSGSSGVSQLNSGAVTVNFSTAPSGATPGGNGGNIDLSGSNAAVIIDTTASALNSKGGDVTLAAFANGSSGGKIVLNATGNVGAINTYGSGTAGGGNVNVYAGCNPSVPSTTVQLGNIITGGAAAGGSNSGAVNIYTAQPTANNGSTVTFNINGSIGAGQSIVNVPSLSNYGGVIVGTVVTTGAGGNGGSAGSEPGGAGGDGGNVVIKAGGNITAHGSVESFGGGGGGALNGAGGDGGRGGAIDIESSGGFVTVFGDLNTSGGGGGGNANGCCGKGGAANAITIYSPASLEITGVVLAAGGGTGGVGGGGSFGGAGGSNGEGAKGGSGTFGGGGGGAGTPGNVINGGGGGGGGFGGSGGGGGGSGQPLGGGGIGGIGGPGGGSGGTGGSGTGPSGGLGGNGGAGGLGGGGGGGGGGSASGNGNNGSSASGSEGGAGGTGAVIWGGPGGSSGSSDSLFGTGGSDGGNAGGTGGATSGGAGGNVQLTGSTIRIDGTITGGSVGGFQGESINAQGSGGSITLTQTGGQITNAQYSANADYSSTTRNVSAPTMTSLPFVVGATPGGSAGSLVAPTVTIDGNAPISNFVTSGSFSYGNPSVMLWESTGPRTVTSGQASALTPCELIAVIQVNQGAQTLVVDGNGAAIGGSFAIAPQNLPAGNFATLNLPAGVTATVAPSIQAINYSGSATINGTINFAASAAQLNVGCTTTIGGSVNFQGGSGVLTSGGDISGSGIISGNSISLNSTTGNIGTSAHPLNLTSGNSGSNQLMLTASAPANTPGSGNIYILDSDRDLSGTQPGLLIGTLTAGSGSPVEGTTGNMQITTTAGSIGVDGATTASTSITLLAQASISQVTGSGSLSSGVISLTGTNVGTQNSAVSISNGGNGVLLLVNATAGGAFLTDSNTGDLTLGNIGAVGNLVVSTNATMKVDGAVSAAAITITVPGDIQQGNGSLNATNITINTGGNVGSAQAPIAFGWTTTVQLNAPKGSAYLSDSKFLTINNSAVGGALVVQGGGGATDQVTLNNVSANAITVGSEWVVLSQTCTAAADVQLTADYLVTEGTVNAGGNFSATVHGRYYTSGVINAKTISVNSFDGKNMYISADGSASWNATNQISITAVDSTGIGNAIYIDEGFLYLNGPAYLNAPNSNQRIFIINQGNPEVYPTAVYGSSLVAINTPNLAVVNATLTGDPLRYSVTSLDLTDPTIAGHLAQLQQQDPANYGGSLILNNSGIAVGGSIILVPQDFQYLPSISALDIPAGVTVQFQGFGASRPVNVALINTSTVTEAIVKGLILFTGVAPGDKGILNVSSTQPTATLLSISQYGNIVSSATLAVNVAGQVSIQNLGNFTLASNLSAQSISITTSGSILSAPGASLSTANLTLNAGGTIGTSLSSLSISAPSVTFGAYTPGNIFITNASNIPVSCGAITAGGSVQLTSASALTINGAIASAVGLYTTPGSGAGITIAGQVGSTGAPVVISADGDISQALNAGSIVGGQVSLVSASGSIGTGSAELRTATSVLSINAAGNAFISNSGGAQLLASACGGTLDLVTSGSLVISGAVTAPNLSIAQTQNNANLIIAAQTGAASSSVTLSTVGQGVIETVGAGQLLANSLSLTSGTGSIVAQVGASLVTANTGGAGQVAIYSSNGLTLGSSMAGGSFQVFNNGGILKVGNISTNNGFIHIQTNGSSLEVLSGSSIAANGGDVLLLNTSPAANNTNINVSGSVTAPFGITLGSNQAISITNSTLTTTNGALNISALNGITVSSAHLSSAGAINLLAYNGSYVDNGSSTYQAGGAIAVYGSGTSGLSFAAGTNMTGASIDLIAFGTNGALTTAGSSIFTATAGPVSTYATTATTVSGTTFNASNNALTINSLNGITLNAATVTSKYGMSLYGNAGAFTDNGGSTLNAGLGGLAAYGSGTGTNGITISTGSTVAAAAISLNAVNAKSLLITGATITANAINGYIVTSSGDTTTITNSTLQSTAAGGQLVVSSPLGITVNAGTGTSKFVSNGAMVLYAGGGAFTDSAGNSYNAGAGPINVYGANAGGNSIALASDMSGAAITLNGIGTNGGVAITAATLTGTYGLTINSTGAVTLGTSVLKSSQGPLVVSASNGISLTTGQLNGSTGIYLYGGNGAFADNGGTTFNGGSGTLAIYGYGTATNGVTISAGSTATAADIYLNAFGGRSLAVTGATLTANGTNGYLYASSGNTTTVTGSALHATGAGGELVLSSADGITVNAGTTNSSLVSNGAMQLNAGVGAFTDNGGNSYNAGIGVVNIYGSGATGLTLGAGSTVNARAINLVAYGSSGLLSIGGAPAQTTLNATSGELFISSSLSTTITHSVLTAGIISQTAPPSGTLAITDISSAGSIYLLSGGTISVTQASTMTANGGNVQLFATGGGITFGANNAFTANGGNVQFFANGPVAQQPGDNSFTARAMGTPAAFTGGTIEIGAGILRSLFAGATTSVSTTVLGGSNVHINYPVPSNPGVVEAHIYNGGSINLNTSGSAANATNLDMTGGVVVLDSVGAANTLTLDGATFTVNNFRPIAYTYGVAAATEIMVDDNESAHVYRLADIFLPGARGAQALTATDDGATAIRAHTCSPNDSSITFRSGQMFMHPATNMTIHTATAEVHAKKGALLAIGIDNTGVRVAACSGPGDLSISVRGREISLAPGQEIVISNHSLSTGECIKADGIGRRAISTFVIGPSCHAAICDFSIVSMIGNTRHMQVLIHPTTAVEKRIANSLMKTAATVDTVTKVRGAYQARTKLMESR